MAGKSSRGSERLLTLKGNIWWFRRQVPAKARWASEGKAFLMISLQTSNILQAKYKRDELEALTSLQFRQIKAGTRRAFELPGYNPQRSSLTSAERGAINREAKAQAVDDVELELIMFSAEAERDALRSSQRQAFDDAWTGEVDIDHYLDTYLSKADLAPKTKKERRGLVGRFARWCRENNVKLTRVDRRMAGRYVSEVIDEMHPATQRKHLTALKKYWSFLGRRGHAEVPAGENFETGWPWNGQQTEQKGKRVNRGAKVRERRYTDEEVRALLYSSFPLRPDWEPLMMDALKISLLSGMRQAEILTLWAGEVYEDGGGWVFDIQQGKTDAAARKVPVHSDLVGTVQERLKGKSAQDLLFHECLNMASPSDAFGKRFRRWREAVGVDDKREGIRRSLVNFHSARRWFATAADLAGIRGPVIRDVIGHVPDKNDTLRAAYVASTPEEHRRECVEAVRLPGPTTVADVIIQR